MLEHGFELCKSVILWLFSKINDIEFLDTTDYLYEKGKSTVLHGPKDWGHFNYDGYKNISRYIIENSNSN